MSNRMEKQQHNTEETNKEKYRPISILTTVSKVYEKVLHDQMLEAFRDHLSPNLSGSLKNCCSALLKMTEDWRSSLDNKEAVVPVAIDLSNAFDSITHGPLLAKLQAYGFSHSAVKLMTSYLVGRQQRVKVQGTFSTYRTITRGVPHCCSTSSLIILTTASQTYPSGYMLTIPQAMLPTRHLLFWK